MRDTARECRCGAWRALSALFGSLRVTKGGGTDPPLIAGNLIGGAILCDGNVPPPVDGGQANTVTGSRGGQCAAKQF